MIFRKLRHAAFPIERARGAQKGEHGLRLYITGGGTGGHVTPGLAIARYFEHRHPDTAIRFAGSARGIENKLVPREGYPLDAIEIIGLSRSLTMSKPRGLQFPR